jgi:hypothetical protein
MSKFKNHLRTWGAAGALSVLASLGVPAAAGAAVDREDALEVFTRDVFEIVGSSLRNPTAETATDAPLYSLAGLNLGVTWGEWRRATATSRAHCVAGGERTDVRVRLSGLIPGGVYSLFYATIEPDTENPLCPGVERTLPLASKDPDQQPDLASFVADENGEADFQGRADSCLFDAVQVFLSLIYHADGQTYGSLPNRGEFLTQGAECRSSFGHDAMRQVLVLQKW